MKIKIRFALLLLLSTLLFCYCKKQSPPNAYQLPDISSTGENTFACYRNGIPWIARRGDGMEGDFFGDTLVASATVKSNPNGSREAQPNPEHHPNGSREAQS